MKIISFLFVLCFVMQTYSAEDLAKINCIECHSDLVSAKSLHAPFKSNRCIACHQAVSPSGKGKKMDADHPNVAPDMGKNQAALCLKCHTEFAKKFKPKFAHSAIAKNGCTGCHNPHGSDNPKFLKNKDFNQALCFTCHVKNVNWEKGEKTSTHPAIDSDDKCFNCHEVHSGSRPKLLKQEVPALCVTCHDEVAVMKPKGSVHTPVKKGECLSCHSPHYGAFGKLLGQSFESAGYVKSTENSFQLCLTCHDLDSMNQFRNGTQNLHTLHITKKMDGKERGCSVCHMAHGSAQQMQIRTSFTFNKISVPLVFQKEVNGGSCTTACHGKKDYDRVTPVTNKEGR